MGFLYIRGRIFWIRYRDPYTRKLIQKSLKTTNKREANRELKDLEGRLARGDYAHLRDKGLRSFIEEHLRHCENDLRPNTVTDYRTHANIILRWFERNHSADIPLRRITPVMLRDFKAWRLTSVSKRTFNGDRLYLVTIFNRAITDGYLSENPMRLVKAARIERQPTPFLTIKELTALIEHARVDIRPMIVFIASTGVRRDELAHVRWTDIDFDKALLMVANRPAERTKSHQQRKVPIPPETVEMLRRLPQEGKHVFMKMQTPYFRRFGLWRAVKKAAKRAGIERCHIHILRHTYASHLAQEGVSMKILSRLLGHSLISTTDLYAHLIDDNLHDYVNRLPYRGQLRIDAVPPTDRATEPCNGKR